MSAGQGAAAAWGVSMTSQPALTELAAVHLHYPHKHPTALGLLVALVAPVLTDGRCAHRLAAQVLDKGGNTSITR